MDGIAGILEFSLGQKWRVADDAEAPRKRGSTGGRRTDVVGGNEAVLLDKRVVVRRGCGGDHLRRYRKDRHRLHDVGGRGKADGAVSLAIVTRGLIEVRGVRGAGQQEDDGQRQRQELGASMASYGLHVHLRKIRRPFSRRCQMRDVTRQQRGFPASQLNLGA